MNKTLKNCAYSGIISAIVVIPYVILEFLKQGEKLSSGMTAFYYLALFIGLATFIYFIWGYKIIGEKTSNKLLVISAYLTIIITVIGYLPILLPKPESNIANLLLLAAMLILIGAVSIPFGIALLKLKKKFGALAQAAGILNIISGISFITVILSFIGYLLLIPLIVIEIVLMFKAADKL